VQACSAILEEDLHVLAIHARERHLDMKAVFILVGIAGGSPPLVHAAKRILE
jgi:hypothetical protein